MSDLIQQYPHSWKFTILCAFACLLIIFSTRLLGIINYGLLASFVDDVGYVEPAVTFAKRGLPSAPGLASQLAEKHVYGLDESFHVSTPLNWSVRVPFIITLNDVNQGKGLADLAILLFLFGSFFYVASRLSIGWIAFYFACLLLTFRTVGFAAPGRPDLLSASFGLFAVAATYRNTANAGCSWSVLTAGSLCAFSLLSHQFGGVVWTVACLGIITVGRSYPTKFTLFRSLLLFFLGVSLPSLLYLSYILNDFDHWRSQFFWLVNLKPTLSIDPVLALLDVTKHALLRNPIATILITSALIALPYYGSKPINRLTLILVVVLSASIAWRAVSFEHYNSHYNVHFIALICLLGSISIPSLLQCVAAFSSFAPILVYGMLVAALFLGLVGSINPISSVWLLPQKQAYAERREVIATIPMNASVLVTCDLYFEVDRSHKTAMAHHENLSLDAFEYIVSSTLPIPVADTKDQWFDTLTFEQNSTLSKAFEVVKTAKPRTLSFHIPLTPVQPQTKACYLLRRTDSGSCNERIFPRLGTSLPVR
jgi:hypothetical protein